MMRIRTILGLVGLTFAGIQCQDTVTSPYRELTCDSGQVMCDDGKNCYSLAVERCNDIFECEDGSDEKNCSFCYSGVQCEIFEGSGQVCIPRRKICNAVSDCTDNQDEPDSCWCQEDKFRCLTLDGFHLCIGNDEICDSDWDCKYGEDENPSLCGCQSGFYCHRIPNGQYGCLNSSDICNGDRQCINGYDEGGDLCKSAPSGTGRLVDWMASLLVTSSLLSSSLSLRA